MTFPMALAHERTENGEKVVRPFYENASNYPSWFAMSTVENYAKFLIMHMNKGRFENQIILSPSSIREMHRTQVSRYNLHQFGCGLTFISEEYNGVSTIRHGGAIGTYTSFMLCVPEKRIAVVTMSIQDYGIDLAYEVLDKLLDVKPIKHQPKMMTPNDLVWNRYVGYYLGSLNGLAHIFIDHQQLKIQLNGTEMTLHAFEEDVYFAKDPEGNPLVTVGFVLDGKEQNNYIVVDGGVCKRVGQEVVSPPMVDWFPLEGKHCNGAITFGLKVIKDQLFLLDEDEQLFCKPLFGNLFYTEKHGLLEIKEIENKRIMVVQDN